ncbi:hypothetical protein [Legionella massiliensis]|nr:hypothetical protein [Legionella massiliensis]
MIEKSQEEIEEVIALVESSNLREEIKPFVIGCINLASWIPKALVEHKITISNLKRLIFGKGAKTTRKQSPTIEKSEASNQASQEDKKFKGLGAYPTPRIPMLKRNCLFIY